MSLLAQPGASRTTSPTRASDAAACTACAMALVSVDSIRITGTWGACRVSAWPTTSRSTPSSTAPRSLLPWVLINSSKLVPLAWPPASQTMCSSNACSAASAACGFVAFESSTQRTPSWSAIVSILWAPTRTRRRPSRTAAAGTPNDRASAAAASALATLCGTAGETSVILASSSAESRRCSTKARSTSRSSTMPSIEMSGMPRVKPMARAPSTTSASSTSRTAAECSDRELDQCSWWLESSTAKTSYRSGSRTISMMGRPMLPTAAVRRPAAVKIDSSICVVVVLPLVPVMPSHGTTLCGRLSRQASSTSLQIGRPRWTEATSREWSGCHPVVISRSASGGSASAAPGPSLTVPPSISNTVALSALVASSRSSRTVTVAPDWSSPSAAAKPETPTPATTTWASCQGDSPSASGNQDNRVIPPPRPARPVRSRLSSCASHPFGIEDAQSSGNEESGDDPKSHHDGHLSPVEQLEVVVDGRHLEQPAALRDLEKTDLQDDRHHLDHQQATENDQQQFGTSEDRHSREGAAERQGSRVAHEDLGRLRIPPQKAETGARQRDRDHREVVRVPHLIAFGPGRPCVRA